MILPIGSNCYLASSLKTLGLRKHSYPFDWVYGNNVDNMTKVLLTILTTKDIEGFCQDFFDMEKNTTAVLGYNKHTFFQNTKYDLEFPHDDVTTIQEKYTRRFRRLRDHFYNDEEVFLVYADRWTYQDNKLYKLFKEISKLRSDVKFITVNAIDPKLPDPKLPNISSYYIPYPEEARRLAEENEIWTYDQTTYNQNLVDILRDKFN